MTYYNNFMNDQYMAEVDDQLEWLEMNGQWNVYYLVRGFEVQTLIHMDKLQKATREASALKKHAQQRHDEGDWHWHIWEWPTFIVPQVFTAKHPSTIGKPSPCQRK